MIETPMKSTGGSWAVPDGWGQGKGVYGGLIAGALVNAATERLIDKTRALRALTMHFLAPPDAAPSTISVETIREGGASSTLEARLLQGSLKAHAMMVFSKPRPGAPYVHETPAFDPAWEKVDIVPVEPPMAPIFAQHFEYRPVGAWPFSGGEKAESSGWVRPREFSGKYDATLIVAIADAFWHSVHVRAQSIRPSLTVTFSVELYGDPGAVPLHAPLFHHGVTWVSEAGYASERRTLWSPDGKLLAVNNQAIAVL